MGQCMIWINRTLETYSPLIGLLALWIVGATLGVLQ